MPKPLDLKHSVFDTVDQMLAPEALSELLCQPVTRVDCCQPMNGHSGLAGGQLTYADTNAGRLVLKRTSIKSDWIMLSTQDHQCRAVRLWEYGLLDQLRPYLDHGIIACAWDGEGGWASLMRDLSGKFFSFQRPLPQKLVPAFLDPLAGIHAVFWNDPRLLDPLIGLEDGALTFLGQLPFAQTITGQEMGVLPDWIKEGWEVAAGLLDSDVYRHMHELIMHPRPLIDALGRFPFTLLHGDYRAENLAYIDRPLVIDWQIATHSLMTIDLAWFLTWIVPEGKDQEEAIQYYRQRLEGYLNVAFDDPSWQAMFELGRLVDALRCTFYLAYWSKHSDAPEQRAHNERMVNQRNHQVRAALRWL
jgi:hypothetical protein